MAPGLRWRAVGGPGGDRHTHRAADRPGHGQGHRRPVVRQPDCTTRARLTHRIDATQAAHRWRCGAGSTPTGPAANPSPQRRAAGPARQRCSSARCGMRCLTIPLGRTKELWRDRGAGRQRRSASRSTGTAVGRNPVSILVPCHRVIGANGSLTGYAGGLPRKERLLQHEGVLLDVKTLGPDRADRAGRDLGRLVPLHAPGRGRIRAAGAVRCCAWAAPRLFLLPLLVPGSGQARRRLRMRIGKRASAVVGVINSALPLCAVHAWPRWRSTPACRRSSTATAPLWGALIARPVAEATGCRHRAWLGLAIGFVGGALSRLGQGELARQASMA